MTGPTLDMEHRKIIDELVLHFQHNLSVFDVLLKQLRSVVEHASLQPLIHSVKSRVKDPEHLRDKLSRKMTQALEGGPEFDYTPENLFRRVNDLVGVRLLHLHTRQMGDIHRILSDLLDEHRFGVIEASARTWDLESKAYFNSIGIKTRDSDSLYTSVHYIVDPQARTTRTAEIQVRTLGEEIWGEVDHTINYPQRSLSLSCREQLMALARVTSSCSRLVDSIFATHQDSMQSAHSSSAAASGERDATVRAG
jgi:putative GTP pyrophosphokinase